MAKTDETSNPNQFSNAYDGTADYTANAGYQTNSYNYNQAQWPGYSTTQQQVSVHLENCNHIGVLFSRMLGFLIKDLHLIKEPIETPLLFCNSVRETKKQISFKGTLFTISHGALFSKPYKCKVSMRFCSFGCINTVMGV